MAGVHVHPLREEAGVTLLPGGLYPGCRSFLLKKSERISTRLMIFLSNPSWCCALWYCRLLVLFLRNDRTSITFSESTIPLPDGRGSTLLSELHFSRVISGIILLFERWRGFSAFPENTGAFSPIIISDFCWQGRGFWFVSEERNEVCTDNVSVLRNRVFI